MVEIDLNKLSVDELEAMLSVLRKQGQPSSQEVHYTEDIFRERSKKRVNHIREERMPISTSDVKLVKRQLGMFPAGKDEQVRYLREAVRLLKRPLLRKEICLLIFGKVPPKKVTNQFFGQLNAKIRQEQNQHHTDLYYSGRANTLEYGLKTVTASTLIEKIKRAPEEKVIRGGDGANVVQGRIAIVVEELKKGEIIQLVDLTRLFKGTPYTMDKLTYATIKVTVGKIIQEAEKQIPLQRFRVGKNKCVALQGTDISAYVKKYASTNQKRKLLGADAKPAYFRFMSERIKHYLSQGIKYMEASKLARQEWKGVNDSAVKTQNTPTNGQTGNVYQRIGDINLEAD